MIGNSLKASIAALAMICGSGGFTASGAAPAGVTRPVVVELFTSQGCSSCPPADAVLAEIATRSDVLALGFHVDYWDRLGWKDPLSAPGSTARQNDYAAEFGRKEIYTPQIVIDGRTQLVGSHRDAVLGAIGQGLRAAAAPVSFAADRRSVTIGAGAGKGAIIAVRFLRNRTTTVQRGENAGSLAHDVNGVEEVKTLGAWTGAAREFRVDPPDADHGLAILVQAADGTILGAAALRATES
jgi:hypothetical protein